MMAAAAKGDQNADALNGGLFLNTELFHAITIQNIENGKTN